MARPPVNAVFIVWLRQLKLYFRSRARMIGSLGQPTLFLLSLSFGLGPTFARAGRGDYVQFLAPGIVTMGILFTAVFVSGAALGLIRDGGIVLEKGYGFRDLETDAPVTTATLFNIGSISKSFAALGIAQLVELRVDPAAGLVEILNRDR